MLANIIKSLQKYKILTNIEENLMKKLDFHLSNIRKTLDAFRNKAFTFATFNKRQYDMKNLELLSNEELRVINGGEGVWITLPDGSKIYIEIGNDDNNDDEIYIW